MAQKRSFLQIVFRFNFAQTNTLHTVIFVFLVHFANYSPFANHRWTHRRNATSIAFSELQLLKFITNTVKISQNRVPKVEVLLIDVKYFVVRPLLNQSNIFNAPEVLLTRKEATMLAQPYELEILQLQLKVLLKLYTCQSGDFHGDEVLVRQIE